MSKQMRKEKRETIISKLLLLLAIMFFLPGVVRAASGPLTVHPTNPRYFADPTGKAVYLTGSHTWYAFQDWSATNRDPFVFDDYVELLKDNNHNFVRGWVCKSTRIPWGDGNNVYIQPYKRTGPGTAYDGGLKFDLHQFNEEYFDIVRERVIKLGENDIYMSMMMFWDTARVTDDHWNSHVCNINNNINGVDGDFNSQAGGMEIYDLDALKSGNQPERLEILELHEAYVRKMIDTLGDLDNVLWEIGNELNYPNSVSFQNHFIDYIRDYEMNKSKQHPVGFTAMLSGDGKVINDIIFDSSAEWMSPAKISHNYDVFSIDANNENMVSLADTDHLGNINIYRESPLGDKERDYRDWVWKCFTRGHNPILMDDPLSPSTTSHYLALPAARRYMGDTLKYAERVDLASMTPQNSLSSTEHCLANSGSQYIIYQPNSGSFNVNLVAGTYNYEWFNPTSRIIEESGTIDAANGNKDFVPPFSGEAVLYLSTSFFLIPQTNWTLLYVDSEELVGAYKPAVYTFYGDSSTIWHTEWYESDPPHPHEIQIDLGNTYNISGIRYLPKQDGTLNGIISDYEFYISNSISGYSDTTGYTQGWGAAIASGTFAADNTEKVLLFTPKKGSFIRLIALSEVDNNPWTTIAELNLLGTLASETRTGDLNDDDQIDILDIQAGVNVLLGFETDPEIVQKAKEVTEPLDVCDVLDIQAIVNMTLY